MNPLPSPSTPGKAFPSTTIPWKIDAFASLNSHGLGMDVLHLEDSAVLFPLPVIALARFVGRSTWTTSAPFSLVVHASPPERDQGNASQWPDLNGFHPRAFFLH